MENETDLQSVEEYKNQLLEIELAIKNTKDDTIKAELISLRENIVQLIELTSESETEQCTIKSCKNQNNPLDNEFALFMAEMEKDGATVNKTSKIERRNIKKELEGMKCRAPHEHQWGDIMYHNAIVCSVLLSDTPQNFDQIEVKVMFINPTHQEMLPCPYLMESSCKFDDNQCKYSHGEIVLFSSLQEYKEPNFNLLSVGSKVLAKQTNKLWSRATIKQMYTEKCLVKFDSNQLDLKLELHEVLPIHSEENDEDSLSEIDSDREDIINMSLINIPPSQVLGDWEKHTKGVASKIMQKMGYIVGTGLGRKSDGRIDPVVAMVLPPGKSLDHCMNLREKAGGDQDLFSVEKKLKRLQKRQEKQNLKAYEREKKKVDVFHFLNETLLKGGANPSPSASKSKHRQDIKKETSRNLNVASLKIDEDIKRAERDLYKIKESLSRHSDCQSQMHKNLKQKLQSKQDELQVLKAKATNISHEQNFRNHKKKLTVF